MDRHKRILLQAGLLASLLHGTPALTQSRGNYRTLQWDDLLPEGWNPQSALVGMDAKRIAEGSLRRPD